MRHFPEDTKPRYPDDEINVRILSGLGQQILKGIMPKEMEAGIKEVYFKSKAVEGYYLYINGVEITDNADYRFKIGG
ncbi:MAG TPA: hypothetical protein VMV86_00020 [Methanosarcinales archaeon]|nr:hypothetical protein [Methanosarcinales archaeon]